MIIHLLRTFHVAACTFPSLSRLMLPIDSWTSSSLLALVQSFLTDFNKKEIVSYNNIAAQKLKSQSSMAGKKRPDGNEKMGSASKKPKLS